VKNTLALPRLRYRPYLGVTMLTKLLAGEARCAWQLLVRIRYDLPPEPTTPKLQEWKEKHQTLVNERATELENRGLHIQVEDQNWLECWGKTSGIRLAGKPDIAILERERVTYEDCKTGEPKFSDHVQVMLYAHIAKRMRVQRELSGNVVYPDKIEAVDLSRWSADGIGRRFREVMEGINAGNVLPTASFQECRYCKVRAYCEARIEAPDSADMPDLSFTPQPLPIK
jgi:CRISPR/Cas system-associated exonuclease Cas4 (RecB family)